MLAVAERVALNKGPWQKMKTKYILSGRIGAPSVPYSSD